MKATRNPSLKFLFLVGTLLCTSSLSTAEPARGNDASQPISARDDSASSHSAATSKSKNLFGNVEKSGANETALTGGAAQQSLRINRQQAAVQDTNLNGEAGTQSTPSTPATPALDSHTDSDGLHNGTQHIKSQINGSQRTSGGGLGLVGFYALAPENHGSPYYITNVFPGSDLAHAGVQSGDLLVRIDGKSPFDYTYAAHTTQPGAKVEISVQHGEETLNVVAIRHDVREFVGDFRSYGNWATSHISFMKAHAGEFHGTELF